MQLKTKNIVFFDGVCGLCDHFVELLLKLDSLEELLFCPLQSEVTSELIGKRDGNTVIFLSNGKVYERSEAVIRIFIAMNTNWKVLNIFRITPRCFRDYLYMFVSKNRFLIFEKKEFCKIPTKEQRKRFI